MYASNTVWDKFRRIIPNFAQIFAGIFSRDKGIYNAILVEHIVINTLSLCKCSGNAVVFEGLKDSCKVCYLGGGLS